MASLVRYRSLPSGLCCQGSHARLRRGGLTKLWDRNAREQDREATHASGLFMPKDMTFDTLLVPVTGAEPSKAGVGVCAWTGRDGCSCIPSSGAALKCLECLTCHMEGRWVDLLPSRGLVNHEGSWRAAEDFDHLSSRHPVGTSLSPSHSMCLDPCRGDFQC